METESGSEFQAWFASELEWTRGLRRRKLRRAMRRLGFRDGQREQFAREQMAAQRDPACTVSFEMAGRMPARFTLGEHYACLTGGMYYGPFIIGLDGTEAIRVSRDASNLFSTARVFGVTISKNSAAVSYVIHFVGRGGEQGGLHLDDAPGRDKVLEVLSRRFPAAAGI